MIDTSQQSVVSITADCCPLSIVFISSSVKTEFYLVTAHHTKAIDFLEAIDYLKASPNEQALPFTHDEQHYQHVNAALKLYTSEYVEAADTTSINRNDLDRTSLEAKKFLATIKQVCDDSELRHICDQLTAYINDGIYAQLQRNIKALSREYKNDRLKIKNDTTLIKTEISKLFAEYQTLNKKQRHQTQDITDPQIIISETFVIQ